MIVKNTCITCKDEWKVNTRSHWVNPSYIDQLNFEKHGQFFSVCEDCDTTGNECTAVEID